MEQDIEELNRLFNQVGNKEKALSMSAYMKGLFQFKGIPSEIRKSIQKKWFDELPYKKDSRQVKTLIKLLFTQKEREFHYVAIDLLIKIPKKDIEIEDSKFIEQLVVTNTWWDSVDAIASHFMGKYLEKFPVEGRKAIENWRKSSNFWLNRTCLLAQLKYRNETDFDLLKSLINQFLPNKEFFIQKAIGWTLREYSKYNPEAVREYVNEINLSGLARREATKYL